MSKSFRLWAGTVVAALATTASAVVVAPSANSAESGTDEVAAVAKKVFTASDPAAAAWALSNSERKLLQKSLDNQAGLSVTEEDPAPLSLQDAQKAGLTVTAASGGCWSQYWYVEWYDLLVYHTGDTWMQLNWCSNGSSVTSWSVPLKGGKAAGGTTYKGVVGTGARNLGWEVRQYVEFRFTIGPLGANPCMQIRGGATGLYSKQKNCNLS